MPKYKVIYDREACIGSFACAAAAPDFWIYNEDGRADFKGATFNAQTRRWELIIGEDDYDDNQAAAEVCPVLAITIEKIDEKDTATKVGDWKQDPPESSPSEPENHEELL